MRPSTRAALAPPGRCCGAERVDDVLGDEPPVGLGANLHDVESARALGRPGSLQEGQRGGGHPRALASIHRFGGATESGTASRFHLDEHEQLVRVDDEVDLAGSRAEPPREHTISGGFEQLGGERLGTAPERLPWVGGAVV